MTATADSKASRGLTLLEQRLQIAAALERIQAAEPTLADGLSTDVSRAIADIHLHLFDPKLNVSAVRRRCGLRNNNISTRFRHELGEGIRDYIERRRLEAAALLLLADDLEIFLVAAAVGYSYQETFCRAFQRQLGCPPSELAKKKRQEKGSAAGPCPVHFVE